MEKEIARPLKLFCNAFHFGLTGNSLHKRDLESAEPLFYVFLRQCGMQCMQISTRPFFELQSWHCVDAVILAVVLMNPTVELQLLE